MIRLVFMLLFVIFRVARWAITLILRMVQAGEDFIGESLNTKKKTRRPGSKVSKTQPEWEVVSVSKKEGVREERNLRTGVRRLVSTTGTVIQADLDLIETGS